MSIIRRLRDAITGRYTKMTHPAITVAESPAKGLSRLNRRILANAIEDEKYATGSIAANKILRDAILKVLNG